MSQPSDDDPIAPRDQNDNTGQPPHAYQERDPRETPEDSAAREWLANVYRGEDVPQLTVRAVVAGMIVGSIMSISNLYIGLKTGWGLGVTITSCIISFSVFKALEFLIPAVRRNPFTILENNTMASAASAAGYMATAGLVSSIPALTMTTQRVLTPLEMMAWLAAISFLGVFLAVPLKRQLINVDQLPFPGGIATAETLKSMYSAGREAIHKAIALVAAAGVGAVVKIWNSPEIVGKFALARVPLFPGASGAELFRRSVALDSSIFMLAAGALIGVRVAFSMLLGVVIFYVIIGSELSNRGITTSDWSSMVNWTLWPATAMMVASGLLSFGLRWRTALRAFAGLTNVFGGTVNTRRDPLEHVEVPVSWFVVGTALSSLGCILLAHYLFDVTWWMSVVAIVATFLLSIVAARSTGETNITPISAMGKITQLIFGVLAPSNIQTNLMTAGLTAGSASHSADLLTDLKTGYLIGANPRRQMIAQLWGVMAGTLLCVPVYALVVQPEKLGSEEWPAPSAVVWAKVAELLAEGLDKLPAGAALAMVYGTLVGIALTLLEEFVPRKYRPYVPSTLGIGLAGVIPAFYAISMFLGGVIAFAVSKISKPIDEKYTIPVASGLIAGESLLGVAIIAWDRGPEFWEKLLQSLSAIAFKSS